MKIAKVLKRSWFGPWLVAALCVLLLTFTTPRKAEATAVEYAVMLALIIVVCITSVTERSSQNEWSVVGSHLIAAAGDAAEANSMGDRTKEVSRLSKAIGAAKALMGITSSCDNCDEVRTDLQEIIGLADLLKSRALGVVSACTPDGVIEPGEQCDPLAMPTGCPVLTFSTFCSDQCLCEPIIP
jgi:Flp pilus assembly pilin Flp